MKYPALFLFFLWFYFFNKLGLLASDYSVALVWESAGVLSSFLVAYLYLRYSLKYKAKGIARVFFILLPLPFIIFDLTGLREATRVASLIAWGLLNLTLYRVNVEIGYRALTEKLVWAAYSAYSIVGAFIYTYCQVLSYMKYSNLELSLNWGRSLAKSTAFRDSPFLFSMGQAVAPLFIFSVFVLAAVLAEKNLSSILNGLKKLINYIEYNIVIDNSKDSR